MEYSLISFDEYENCEYIAKQILRDATEYNHKDIAKLRGHDVINALNHKYKPNIAAYYSNSVGIPYGWHYAKLMNGIFDINGIYLYIKKAYQLDDIFVETVSGMTAFKDGHRPTMFLNLNNNIERMTFTALHEFTHMYQNEHKSSDYAHALALINMDKMSGDSYPDELKPVEDEANTVASLLLLPDVNLDKDIRVLSYDEIRQKYQMSYTGLYNRLRSYFYYTKGFEEYQTAQAIYAFQRNNRQFIEYIRQYLD